MRYTREDGCRAWLMYGMIQPRILSELLDEAGSAEALYECFVKSRGEAFRERLNDAQLDMLRQHADHAAMHDMMRTLQRLNIGVVAQEDYLYPSSLMDIADPPPLLFFRGNLEALENRCLTMIGMRKSTVKGAMVAHDIARELARAGVVIVSGLALGIDSSAHTGCMDGGGMTAGVMACGMDVDYPTDNADVRQRILDTGGVLLSESPLGAPAVKWRFHSRNRILSGLSRAVILMEAMIRSGSMTTVQHALDQGREVFAYPGIPGSEESEAAHQILREGARYFTTAEDILEDMGWLDVKPPPSREEKAKLPLFSAQQQAILQQLRKGEQSMDELVLHTGLPIAELTTALTMLQLLGQVRSLPGKLYSLV